MNISQRTRKEHAIGVFLDLSKAFDTVNHDILFDKLEHYGIRVLASDLVKSYFSERSQFVDFKNFRSFHHKISCGVSQGLILGSLFFILYVYKQTIDYPVFINKQSRVSETMFLGVLLDDNLTWKPHISLVANKISKSIDIIHKYSFFFHPSHCLRTLKLLKCHDIYLFQLGLFMFSFKSSTIPPKLRNVFLRTNQIHS